MKAIIYCRKSTDRGDRQQLSIESQVEEAKKIAKREGLEVIKIFKETQSAKEPGRPKFNEMMKIFSKGKADCIITWKLNRLARNPVDEGTIKWSIQSGVIKAIYTEGEVFKIGDNVLIMGMHFGMSTQYILDLQKDIKRGIKKKILEGGVCQKAPLGYINNVLNKSIEVDPIKSKWVKEIFEMRAEGVSYKLIAETLYKKGVKNKNGKVIPYTSIITLLKNKFYIGLVLHNGEYYKGNYKTFISKKLFDKAQGVGKGLSYSAYNSHRYHLKGLLKDSNGYLLSGYHKKGNIYYKTNTKSKDRININEKLIFSFIEEEIKKVHFSKSFKELNTEIILAQLEQQKPQNLETIKEVDYKIRVTKEQKENLLNLRLDGEIDKKTFNEKNNALLLKLEDLEQYKKEIKNNSLDGKISLFLELKESLYSSYNLANNEFKSIILKKLFLELFLNNKKELTYAENSLFKTLILLQNMSNNVMEVPTINLSVLAERLAKTNLDKLKDICKILKTFKY